MLESSDIAQLFDRPAGPPARFWDAVRCAEGPSRVMLAVPQSCGAASSFAVMDFLRAQGLPQNVLDGSTCDPSQHCHANVVMPSLMNTVNSQVNRLLGNSNEHAALTVENIGSTVENGRIEFDYSGTAFRMYVFTYSLPNMGTQRLYILTWPAAGSEEKRLQQGRRLVADVFSWSSQLREEMWVYNGVAGGWRKDKSFYRAVHASDPADLILPHETLAQLYRDTTTFFESQALFKQLNITWKRGILLLGPPGNGKTGVIKVLAKQCAASLGVPALYVQTAKTNSGPEFGMTAIFQKARREAPCLLILEDIETLVSGDMRTVMLNQLDGIESNDGILVIATANDAAKLDPAILQRPSRFDAKYTFALPDEALRDRFVRHWLTHKVGLQRLQFDDADAATAGLDALVAETVRQTAHWSFAFLKELFISFLLEQAAKASKLGHGGSQAPGSVQLHAGDLLAHVTLLQKQVDAHLTEAQQTIEARQEARPAVHTAVGVSSM